MKSIHHQARLATLVAGTFSAAAGASAFEATDLLSYSVGPVTLRPRVSLAERYDDNVLFRPAGLREDDFITTISPSLNVVLGEKPIVNPWIDPWDDQPNYFSVRYTLEENAYAQNDDLSYMDQIIDIDTRLTADRIALNGNDRISFLEGVIGGGTNLGRRAKRTVFGDNYTVSYQLGHKTAVYLTGNHSTVDYGKGTALYDYNTLRGTGGFLWKVTEKTGLFGELYYGQSATDPNTKTMGKNPHMEFIGGFLGVQGDFTTRLKGSLKAGYESRWFAGQSDSKEAPVVDTALSYRITERLTGRFNYSRFTTVSMQRGNVSMASDAFGLNLSQRLSSSGKLIATGGLNYQMDSYDSTGFYANRQDDWWRANVGVTYFMRSWANAFMGYEFEVFSSDYQTSASNIVDYHANRVTLRMTIGY